MKQKQLNLIANNHLLKIVAVMLGFLGWLHINYNVPICYTISVPISFYNTTSEKQIIGPETCNIKLRGTRSALFHIDPQTCSIHLNHHDFAPGLHTITITPEKIFLPDNITMVHCNPCTFEVL